MEYTQEETEDSMKPVSLVEPHFDEEATLLSAKPVVPLEVVKAKARSGRRLAFALVVVVGLLVGALGATLFYKVWSPQPATDVTGVDNNSLPAHPAIAGGVAAVESPVKVVPRDAPTVSEPVVQPVAKDARDARPRVSPRVSSNKSSAPLQTRADQSARREEDREQRRSEKWEERRLRRVENEARRRDGRRHERSTDDLLRIREIFEGSPRP